MEKSFYETLQVLPDASQEVIRAAYRTLTAKYHPDRDPSDEAAEEFAKIQQAFDTLSDAKLRAEYDEQQEMLRLMAEIDTQTARTIVVRKGSSRWVSRSILITILGLAAVASLHQSGMIPYVNRESGIAAYKYGDDWIQVQFKDGDKYEYWASKVGQSRINEMKRLAVSGDGLNTYISTNPVVKHGWSFRNGKSATELNQANRIPRKPSSQEFAPSLSTRESLSLTGRWQTSEGDIVQLTETGNTVRIELLNSNVMQRGTGILTRTGDTIRGTLTGYFYSAPSTKLTSEFDGTIVNANRIVYSVDVVRFIGSVPLSARGNSRFSMNRMRP